VTTNHLHVLTDDEVAPAILKLIRSAKSEVTIVTPYLKLGRHNKNALELAAGRGVKLTFYVRDEDKTFDHEDVLWLLDQGANVHVVEFLHAKIYMNENLVIASSMNMHQTSATNALDFAFVVNEPQAAQKLRSYVSERIAKLADEVQIDAPPKAKSSRGKKTKGSNKSTGFCIRCAVSIPLDPARPLCDEHYTSWAQWENEDYEEDYCHVCGEYAYVSFGKPLCRDCFGDAR